MISRISGISLLVFAMILSGNLVGITTTYAASDSNSVQWYRASSQMVSNNLNDIVVNDRQVYVAVGDEGTILSSSDAKTWSAANFTGTVKLTSAATNGQAFVAAGEQTIVTSKDGVNWTQGNWKKSPTLGELISPSYKKAIDQSYTVNWKTKLPISSLNVESVIWDGQRFVAIGYWRAEAGKPKKKNAAEPQTASLSGTFAITSPDGLKWDIKGIDAYGNKLVFTGKKYVAINFNRVYISADLVEWKEYVPEAFKSRTAFSFKDLIYQNGTFFAVYWDPGISAQTGVIYTSKDGIHWKEETSGFKNRVMNTILWDGVQYWIGGAHGLLLRSENGTDWEHWKDAVNNPWDNVDLAGEEAAINKMIYDGKRYVLVGNRGTIILSDNLMSAEVVRQRIAVDYKYIDYDGNRYVAGGAMGPLMESPDGYDWQPADLGNFTGSYFHWTGVAAGNGIVIALGRIQDGLAIENEEYYYSPRPGAWERKKFPLKVRAPDGVEFRDGKFYVYDDGGYMASTDGINWSRLVKLNPPMERVVSNGKVKVGLTAMTIDKTSTVRPGGDVYASPDGSKWTTAKIRQNNKSVPFAGKDLVWNGKRFIAVGVAWPHPPEYEPAVFSSSDGLSWSYRLTEARLESMACSVQACVAASDDGDLYASKSDLKFQASPRPTAHRISKVLWDGEKFIALGKSGTILVSKKPPGANKFVEEQIVPFTIKYDPNAAAILEAALEQEAAAFRAEAEKQVAVVKRIGSENKYEPFVQEKYDEWLCRLNSIEYMEYYFYKSGEYRNKLSFAVFFNGIDRRQLKTAGEIIGEHIGASQDEVNAALKTIVDGGNTNANGTARVGDIVMKYTLTMVQGQNSPYGELEIWY
ncbi:hypothetical protein [Cohnella hongkongensis]|uniref:DUF6242 domain-containing protein n=1 Tax=Cohnella hongkongensis TaxID=178337 RepID=A0ABV9FB97_9BACL